MAWVVTPRRRNEGFPYLSSVLRVDDDDVDWRRSKGVFLIIIFIIVLRLSLSLLVLRFFFVRRRGAQFFFFMAENYSHSHKEKISTRALLILFLHVIKRRSPFPLFSSLSQLWVVVCLKR
jgi:hypothetical protein